MLNEVELNDSALEYIKEELAIGDSVAKSLLQFIAFEQGVIRTFLPHDVIDAENLDFRDSIAEDYQAMYSATHKKIVEFVTAYLSQQMSNIVVFETLASPGDPYLKQKEPQYFSNQQNVYLYCTGDSFDEQKVSQIISGARGYPCVGILTALPTGKTILSEQSINNDFLQDLVKGTEYIIIGAFDEDGFLFWSKQRV